MRIELAGETIVTTSDDARIVDARLHIDADLALGVADAHETVGDRKPVATPVHVITDAPVYGVVCDIDDTGGVTGIAHLARAAGRTLTGSSRTRRSVPGMASLLYAAIEEHDHAAVVYLSNGPWNFAGIVERFLHLNGFPAGAILMTDWGILPRR